MNTKANLRAFYKNARLLFLKDLDASERKRIFNAIGDQVSRILQARPYQSIGAYIPKEGEIDLRSFLKMQKAAGKKSGPPLF